MPSLEIGKKMQACYDQWGRDNQTNDIKDHSNAEDFDGVNGQPLQGNMQEQQNSGACRSQDCDNRIVPPAGGESPSDLGPSGFIDIFIRNLTSALIGIFGNR